MGFSFSSVHLRTEGEMNTYEYFTVAKIIGEIKWKLATGVYSEANRLGLGDSSALLQEEV